MINRGIHPVLGVNIHAVDYSYAKNRILDAARNREPFAVSALAVHGVMTGFQDEVHRRRLNGMDMVVPDGQPVRWALKWLHGIDLPDRVYGPALTLGLLEAAARERLPLYFYGSTPPTLSRLTDRLRQKYPGLVIAGSTPSRFRRVTPEEKAEITSRILESGARMVFVGLGCPRQEVWAYEYRKHLSMPLIAIGAAFDFHAGTLPQAPEWMQANGFEWLFRLMQEPRRLWKRYVLLNPAYLAGVGLELLARKGAAVPAWMPPVLFPDGKEPEERFG